MGIRDRLKKGLRRVTGKGEAEVKPMDGTSDDGVVTVAMWKQQQATLRAEEATRKAAGDAKAAEAAAAAKAAEEAAAAVKAAEEAKAAEAAKAEEAKKPAAKKPAARKPAAKKPAARKPAAKKPAAKKPAAKKPAAKKPAAKKPAAKKPAAKKPAARKPAAKKPAAAKAAAKPAARTEPAKAAPKKTAAANIAAAWPPPVAAMAPASALAEAPKPAAKTAGKKTDGHRVHVFNPDEGVDAVFFADDGEFLLDAAGRAGVELPYSCLNGGCFSCAGKFTTGKEKGTMHDQYVMEQPRIDEGYVLLCCCSIDGDVDILTHQEDSASI